MVNEKKQKKTEKNICKTYTHPPQRRMRKLTGLYLEFERWCTVSDSCMAVRIRHRSSPYRRHSVCRNTASKSPLEILLCCFPVTCDRRRTTQSVLLALLISGTYAPCSVHSSLTSIGTRIATAPILHAKHAGTALSRAFFGIPYKPWGGPSRPDMCRDLCRRLGRSWPGL